MTEAPSDFAPVLAKIREADALLCEDAHPFPLPIGELAPVVAGALCALRRQDWWVPSLRERVGAVLRDVPVERLREGTQGARPYRVAPAQTSPALRALLAVGLAAAQPDVFVLVHLGIGSFADGAAHEALNLASLMRPNVLFLVSVHPLDGSAPLPAQLGGAPAAIAHGHGIPTSKVDGTDVAAVYRAVSTIRSVTGPHLLVAALASRAEQQAPRAGQEAST